VQFGKWTKPLYYILRSWFASIMIFNGRYIFSYGNDTFWHHFFKTELHFIYPDLMFYLAKGSEFFGGLLLLVGIMPRIAASLLAFTMLIATLSANVHQIYGGYGTITFSYFLFACLFAISKHLENPKIQLLFLLTCIRLWFGSILIFNSIVYFSPNNPPISLFSIAEMISGLLILIGLFSRILSGILAAYLFFQIVVSIFHSLDWNGYDFLLLVILFWYSCISFIVPSTESI
jgi:uncharacterized membrane protein YphA (DoxX/SURF4 family)